MLLSVLLMWAWVVSVGATHFTADGVLRQLEYANTAVQRNGGSCVGFRCQDGAIIASARRRSSSRLELRAPQKVYLLDGNRVLIAVSGLLFEAPLLIAEARRIIERYRAKFDAPIPIEKLCSSLCDILHMLTQSHNSRPLGVSLLVSGDDGGQPALFTVDPEGALTSWRAAAIGHNREQLTSELCELRLRYVGDPSVEETWPGLLTLLKRARFLGDDISHAANPEAGPTPREWDMEVYALGTVAGQMGEWQRVRPADY